MSVAIAERASEVGRALADRELDAALAVATRGDGLTFVALRAPVIATTSIVAAWPDVPLVAWSSPDGLAIVGVGIARELRGVGADRWRDVVRTARETRCHGVVVADAPRRVDARGTGRGIEASNGGARDTHPAIDSSRGRLDSIEVLGFARPRFLGGGAFAPTAADAAPWTGFGDAWFVLPRWTYVHDGETAWLVLAIDASAARESAQRHSELATFRTAFATTTECLRHATSDGSSGDTILTTAHASVDLWRAQVEAITSAISNGACSKIVAARTCSVALSSRDDAGSELDKTRKPIATVDHARADHARADHARADHARADHAARALATLDTRHADCFRVLVRPPGGGTLVAATPERLVRLDGDTIRCDALAGTVRLESPDAEARLRASDKDRREHAIVVDAIRESLEQIGAHVDVPSHPDIKTLRHVLHLHTPIRASAPRGSISLHLLDLAARLHPTPAVGGTPTAFALDWIRDHEPVPRGWYASPVGWFDLDGNGELAVAIRSGVLVGNRAHLWAGAGIVAGSDPDRELAETELKLRAMLGALRDPYTPCIPYVPCIPCDGVEP